MRGRIGIGLVIVAGPTEELSFTVEEQTKVVADVQNALSWLGSNVPDSNITWSYDIQPVALSAPADPSIYQFDELEEYWRDPALTSLGYSEGLQGVEDYVDNLVLNLDVDFAYCVFFTKYPVGHFAYAITDEHYLVMDYDNDGWTPASIDRVFAHETCHIFGAPDEYAGSGCDCGGSWGTSGGSNANCENCSHDLVPCIMRENTWDLCSATPGHLGW